MQNLPKIVQARLARASGEGHPDVDLLTAFAEQSLGGSEREQVMKHVSRCRDCRDVVALALPAFDDASVSSSSVVRSGSLIPDWLTWPALRWGVVAAGIVLVTSVGLLQYKERTQQNAALIPGRSHQQERVSGASQSPQSYSDAAGPASVTTPEVARQIPMQKPSRSPRTTNAVRPTPEVKAVFPLEQASKAAPGVGSLSPAAPAPSTLAPRSGGSAPTAQNEQQLAQNQVEPFPQKQALNHLDVVKAKDSVDTQAESNAPLADTVPTPNLSLPKGLASAPQWSISSVGVLQRSLDAGNTWEDVDVNQSAFSNGARMGSTVELKIQKKDKKARSKELANPVVVFRAVAAVGPEVWAGGSSAMLFHSLDSGSHWTRVVPLEANSSLAGDIVSIEFVDPQHGKIATSAGELWITSDDGQVWHKQQ